MVWVALSGCCCVSLSSGLAPCDGIPTTCHQRCASLPCMTSYHLCGLSSSSRASSPAATARMQGPCASLQRGSAPPPTLMWGHTAVLPALAG